MEGSRFYFDTPDITKIPFDRYPQVKDTKGTNIVIPKNIDDDLLYKIKNINVEIGYDVQVFLLNQFEDHQCFFLSTNQIAVV